MYMTLCIFTVACLKLVRECWLAIFPMRQSVSLQWLATKSCRSEDIVSLNIVFLTSKNKFVSILLRVHGATDMIKLEPLQ